MLIAELKKIKKKYLGNPVFENLDLRLEAGNFYAVLGKNGSGKSTLIRILAHREAVNSGEAIILGVDLDHDFAEIGNEVAYISEATYMPPGATVQDLIELYAKIYRGWDRKIEQELVAGFRLDPKKKSGELSRGQLVQMALVLNLSYSPRLILLDEVTAVLDASAREFLMCVLPERVKKGATVLLATNIVTEVQHVANALILIGDRRVKVNAPKDQLSSEFVKLKKEPNNDNHIFRKDSCIEVGLSNNGIPLYLIAKKDFDSKSVIPGLISSDPITPNEIFIYLTRMRD